MNRSKLTIVCFIVAFLGVFQNNAQAEISEARRKEIKECFDKATTCSAQCEGLSNRNDEIEEGFFYDSKTSPRERCKKACDKPCDKYMIDAIGEVGEALTK